MVSEEQAKAITKPNPRVFAEPADYSVGSNQAGDEIRSFMEKQRPRGQVMAAMSMQSAESWQPTNVNYQPATVYNAAGLTGGGGTGGRG